MKTHMLNRDIPTTWVIAQPGRWIQGEKSTITVEAPGQVSAYGIYEPTSVKNNVIEIRGDISVSGANQNWAVSSGGTGSTILIAASCDILVGGGVQSWGNGARIVNRADLRAASVIESHGDDSVVRNLGDIEAHSALISTGDNARLFNSGQVESQFIGIALSGDGAVATNTGSILAKTLGVTLEAGSTFVNRASGHIAAETAFKASGTGLDASFVNEGMIAGSLFAYKSEDAHADKVVNRGVMVGAVRLGDGNDRFDTVGGHFVGTVEGGLGDDVYVIDNWQASYVEKAGEGTDTVRSASGHSLGEHVENLTLIGGASLYGVGNDLANIIMGNRGDNIIYGNAGEDGLYGGAGMDELTGGSEADLFGFTKGYGKDVIHDFHDDVDIIYLFDISGIEDFDDLAGTMTQSGDNVVIQFGQGDRLTIEKVVLADLDEFDFLI